MKIFYNKNQMLTRDKCDFQIKTLIALTFSKLASSDTRNPWFKSSHLQILFITNCIEKTKKQKRGHERPNGKNHFNTLFANDDSIGCVWFFHPSVFPLFMLLILIDIYDVFWRQNLFIPCFSQLSCMVCIRTLRSQRHLVKRYFCLTIITKLTEQDVPTM